MRYASVLLGLTLGLSIITAPASTAFAAKQPNIVMFLIDDMGWMDLACQGNKQLDTPNTDRLASQGMRFTDAYAAAPVCSPTRASILTGQSPARLHLTNHLPGKMLPKDSKFLPSKIVPRLNLDYVTVAEHVRKAGYRTAFLGKWHVASEGEKEKGTKKEDYFPLAQGFEVNYGGCHYGGPPTFFDPYRIPTLANRKEGEYLPDRLADEAIGYMEKHREEPFMLFLWNYTVHWPMEAKPKEIAKYQKRSGYGLKDARYGAMIDCLDQAVGRILAALDRLQLADDTLVVFTSDNGGYLGVSDCRPLREGKGYLYEGGIRVPLIVRWPGKVKAGTLNSTPVVSTDFFPTFLEVAGVKPDPNTPLDGESLVPVFQQTGKLKRDAIYFHYPNFAWHKANRLGGAIRAGDWKLIERFDDGSLELFNLADDLSEKNDLAKTHPEKAKALQQKLVSWRKASGAWMPRVRAE
jgi:arylsulfatase A